MVDEADFRHRARRYRRALHRTEIIYAEKSLLTIIAARWARKGGLGFDICPASRVGPGWATSSRAGVTLYRVYSVKPQLNGHAHGQLAGRGPHRRLLPQHGIELQHSRQGTL
ncbi:hypothetical protein [Mycobacterium uberis]|uniref:hypothetical protein n=1 Tax=Mycobacterium uberis TaxID=2162698 RepID=UPI000E300BB5